MRKKWMRSAAALLCAAYTLASCSGHFRRPVKAKSQYEKSFAAEIMWFGNDGSALEFFSDGSGRLDGRSFLWTEHGGRIECVFAPYCSIGKTEELFEEFDKGLPVLKGERTRYTVSIPPSNAGDPKAEELLAESEYVMTKEELVAQEGQAAANMCFGFIGWNYKYGGKSPETGFDCSGLVYYVYEQLGYRLERVANAQSKQGILIEKEDMQPGDVLCFGAPAYCSHVGIYVGQGYYIHAMGAEYGVVASSLDDPYLKRPQYEVRRFAGCDWLKIENIEAALAAGLPTPTPPVSE